MSFISKLFLIVFVFCSQLLQCQEYLLDLEKSLENPENSDRVRLLGGKDLNPEELQKKMEEVSITIHDYVSLLTL